METGKKAKREKRTQRHEPTFILTCFHADERVLRATAKAETAVERKKSDDNDDDRESKEVNRKRTTDWVNQNLVEQKEEEEENKNKNTK